VVAAVSGGRDSVVLLHLLRFSSDIDPGDIVVAHYDHRMREGSEEDARWVAELAAGWGVGFFVGVADGEIRDEEGARTERYRFLHEVREEVSGRVILTAHHADDQAETVLFRIARGTGLGGLEGIQRRRADGVIRPLLDLWGEELAAYADTHGLEWRTDPTNATHGPARNFLRHRVLPELEKGVAPGARRALVRLAENAASEGRATRELLDPHIRAVILELTPGRLELDREALLDRPGPLRALVLRGALERAQVRLGQTGTDLLTRFCAEAPSGASLALRGGGRAVREYERILVLRGEVAEGGGGMHSEGPPGSPSIRVMGPSSGSEVLALQGTPWRVTWDAEEGRERDAGSGADAVAPAGRGGEDASTARSFDLGALTFPLVVRAVVPGDRIRLRGGTRKVKKVFNDARVGVTDRPTRPVLVDGAGGVLWIPGVAISVDASPSPSAAAFRLRIEAI